MKTQTIRLVLERSVYNRPTVSQENAGPPRVFLALRGTCRAAPGLGAHLYQPHPGGTRSSGTPPRAQPGITRAGRHGSQTSPPHARTDSRTVVEAVQRNRRAERHDDDDRRGNGNQSRQPVLPLPQQRRHHQQHLQPVRAGDRKASAFPRRPSRDHRRNVVVSAIHGRFHVALPLPVSRPERPARAQPYARNALQADHQPQGALCEPVLRAARRRRRNGRHAARRCR